MTRIPAPRFGIGEWYGRSFVKLSPEERRNFAKLALRQAPQSAPICPFQSDEHPTACSKPGGICSLRLYSALDDGDAEQVTGGNGSLRVVCPHRFKQNSTIYSAIGTALLGTATPRVVGEVRFLRRDDLRTGIESDEAPSSEDVGNIDHVLVRAEGDDLEWCALEIQAVYFSGVKMSSLFEQIKSHRGDGLPFPKHVRRPDYRSSGPKRLMPQLQIKVPTLRRWGKKMALVVDRAWFDANVVGVPTVTDISNGDIAWFLADFEESTDPVTMVIGEPQLQTLERAVEGLTGGYPVTLAEFEAKIRDKLNPVVRRRRS